METPCERPKIVESRGLDSMERGEDASNNMASPVLSSLDQFSLHFIGRQHILDTVVLTDKVVMPHLMYADVIYMRQ